MERSESTEKHSTNAPSIEEQAQDFGQQLCGAYDNSLAEYRFGRAVQDLMNKPTEKQKDFADAFEKTGGTISNDGNPTWIPNMFFNSPEIHNVTRLTINSDCNGKPQEAAVIDDRKIERDTGNQRIISSEIDIKSRPQESTPRVDELIHDALSMELKAKHPELDRKTQLFAADILDQAAKGPDDTTYVNYPAKQGQYKGLARDLLKDPERAKEAIRVLNELVPGDMWSVSEDKEHGLTFALSAGTDAKLVWNKDGDIVDGNYKDQTPTKNWFKEMLFLQSQQSIESAQVAVLAEASKNVHEALIMHPTPMMKRLDEPRDPNFVSLYDSYFKR